SLVWVGSGDAARGVACPALRSSDLGADPLGGVRAGQDQGPEDAGVGQVVAVGGRRLTPVVGARRDRAGAGAVRARGPGVAGPGGSEEHTPELRSREKLVCRLPVVTS